MIDASAIIKEVLAKVKPSEEEESKFRSNVGEFIKKTKAALGDARAILGGSGAKGTWISGVYDIDIFVLFPYNKYRERSSELADMLENRLKKNFKKYVRLHGSRDYFQINIGSYLFEIVPILSIKNSKEAINITDVSPLHAGFVVKNSNDKLRDDIRLAKQFCKAAKCYGAESHIQGFSGYVLEILVIYYGGFIGLLKNAVKWQEREVIDIKKHYKRSKDVFTSINFAKLHSPLIIIDPVDKKRNAAAALNRDKFYVFKERAKQFLAKPSNELFVKEEVSFESLKTKYKNDNLAYTEVKSLKGKEDVVGSKLLAVFGHLKHKLKEFRIIKADWDFDHDKGIGKFWFAVEKKELDKYEIRSGPPVKLKKYADDFKKKHKMAYMKDGRLFAKVPRTNNKIEGYVKEILKDGYIQDRIKEVKLVKVK